MNADIFVCTVGGSPAPIIFSLQQHAPGHVLFICSASSAAAVQEQILPALSDAGHTLRHSVEVLHNEQDLLACVRDIRAAVERARAVWDLPQASLLADFTGGTKVMSAALVLALMEYDVAFTYIGGGQRSKNGLGTVLDGEERVMQLANPWDVLAFSPVQQLADAFTSCQFTTAARLAADLAARSEQAAFFHALALLCEGYAAWDGFDYPTARTLFPKALTQLAAAAPARLSAFLDTVRENDAALQAAARELAAFTEQRSPCPAYLQDLAANALRREQQGRYDDAVARFYCLLEKAAQVELCCRYGIETSNVKPEQLPEAFCRETPPLVSHDGRIQLPLFRAYSLLACLHNPLGQAFLENQEELTAVLAARNSSLLAHGFSPVSAALCKTLRQLVLRFLHLEASALPSFPTLDPALLK